MEAPVHTDVSRFIYCNFSEDQTSDIAMPMRAYYNDSVCEFLKDDPDRILGVLSSQHHHTLVEQQRWAWLQQITILKAALSRESNGRIFLEFYIPRMGKRADAVLVIRNVVFIIEFKVGASAHLASGFDQVEDYALDLKNFHEGSHTVPIVPVLVSTHADAMTNVDLHFAEDFVASPIATNGTQLGALIDYVCGARLYPTLNIAEWIAKGYKPTPTIIEAARTKIICFVTGVPGSGKTLAGLNIATRRSNEHRDEHAVFLSGNGPLVEVLREALARDRVRRERVSKKVAEHQVRSFIQNVHHFRDHYLANSDIPIEKVVVFDEAQRAWTAQQAASFMQRKRGEPNFNMSEPEFLISVMDRHLDWCTVVCLVGGGQEINIGEAGISEWMSALETRFPGWEVYASPRISLPEYGSERDAEAFLALPRVHSDEHLHLGVSMRSFRAETLSGLVGHIVDNQPEAAKTAFENIQSRYPIYLTRNLSGARAWLRDRARGTERFGLVASSGAQRLRPEGIHIKAEIEPRRTGFSMRGQMSDPPTT